MNVLLVHLIAISLIMNSQLGNSQRSEGDDRSLAIESPRSFLETVGIGMDQPNNRKLLNLRCQRRCQLEKQDCEDICRHSWDQRCRDNCDRDWDSCDRGCTSPKSTDPWCSRDGRSVPHSGSSYMMECLNGRRCNVYDEWTRKFEWGCCTKYGSQRAKCPPEKPWMCAHQNCGRDYCCAESEWDCGSHGGLRPCRN